MDLTASTGVEQINIDSVVFGTNIDGVQEADVAISNLKDTTILELKGLEGADFTLGLDNVGAKGKGKAANIALETSALKNLTIENGDLASFVNLGATGTSANLNSVNTVTATGDGDLTADLSVIGGAKLDVTVGGGNDKITVNADQVANQANTFDLGEGNNTLVAKNATLANFANLSQDADDRAIATLNGVDTLVLSNGGGNASSSGAAWSGSTTISLEDSSLTNLVFNAEYYQGSGSVKALDVGALGTVTLNDASKEFTLGLENVASGSVSIDNAVDLTINAKNVTSAALTAVKVKELTINDSSKDGSNIDITVSGMNTALKTVNLTGEEKTNMTVTASAVPTTVETLTINIGNFGELTYTAKAGSVSGGTVTNTVETFKFTDSDFGSITIKDFFYDPSNASDKLDLSSFGIKNQNDLNIEYGTSSTVITAKDGQFSGEITLDTIGASGLGDDAFIFA